jgi:ketosteroid isomerase-like protein
MRDLLMLMRALDVAWNERTWSEYGDLLSDELVAFSSGETQPHGKPHHIAKAKTFCATFADAKVQTDPYRELFTSGEKTCSVARVTGTAPPSLILPNGEALTGAGRVFDLTFVAICTWRAGRVIAQHEYIDTELMLRQLRGASQ